MTSIQGTGAECVIEEQDGGLSIITLNRPEKLNALDGVLLEDLAGALRAADSDNSVRAIILRGAGRAFCAGADRDAVANLRGEPEIRRHAERMADVQLALIEAETPTIAAVHGYALGAGCGLVAACDFAVAAPDAILGYPEVSNGILPALVTPSLVRAVGRRRALTLLATARRLTANEAAELGLVSHVATEDVMAEARSMASTIAGLPVNLMRRLEHLVEQCSGAPIRLAVELAKEANAADRIDRVAART